MSQTGAGYTLSRELTEIPAAVREAPAPVVPEFDGPYTLRVADPDTGDAELVTEWMHRPHLVQTWEQDWPVERRLADMRAQLSGTFSRPCVLEFDYAAAGQPDVGRRDVAYLELYRAARDEISRLYHADPHDMGFHIATADPDLRGRGIISGWLGQMLEAIFAADPDCRRIMVDPDYRNTPMHRAVSKIGCGDLGEFDVRPDRRIRLFARPRSPQDLPAARGWNVP
ncbi:MAG: acetyltransferase [Nocardia sp.]|nr:acetyltransferase [Nocardia sp.]